MEILCRAGQLDCCQLHRSALSGDPSPSRHKQGMNLPSFRWILCVASQAEWVHLCFIFSLVYIFLSLFFPPIPPLKLHGWPRVWLINVFLSLWHFLTHCQVAGLKFKRRSKMKLGQCVEQLSPTHSGNRCWFASAKVVEMFASWSHSRDQACCALTEFFLTFFVLTSSF